MMMAESRNSARRLVALVGTRRGATVIGVALLASGSCLYILDAQRIRRQGAPRSVWACCIAVDMCHLRTASAPDWHSTGPHPCVCTCFCGRCESGRSPPLGFLPAGRLWLAMGGLKLPAVASIISWPSPAAEERALLLPCRSWSGW